MFFIFKILAVLLGAVVFTIAFRKYIFITVLIVMSILFVLEINHGGMRGYVMSFMQ